MGERHHLGSGLGGFIYLAIVLDAWSRKLVGRAIGQDLRARLMIKALDMALAQGRAHSVIDQSDRGSQYTSVAFGKRCTEMGVRPSMGTVGDDYDNAMAGRFFAVFEGELIDRRSGQTKTGARLALLTHIEGCTARTGVTPRSVAPAQITWKRSKTQANHE